MQQTSEFKEDRNEIVEKRALVHRLKADVQRKQIAVKELTGGI